VTQARARQPAGQKQHPLANMLLQPLSWSVLFLPFTLVYYAFLLAGILVIGVVWLIVALSRKTGGGPAPSRRPAPLLPYPPAAPGSADLRTVQAPWTPGWPPYPPAAPGQAAWTPGWDRER
jgi:hypothetical protein